MMWQELINTVTLDAQAKGVRVHDYHVTIPRRHNNTEPVTHATIDTHTRTIRLGRER